jgi:hypothetical protein
VCRTSTSSWSCRNQGGTKIPYGSAIAVPLEGARPNPRALVAKENYPHEVMARGGFIRGNVMYAVAFKQGTPRPGE